MADEPVANEAEAEELVTGAVLDIQQRLLLISSHPFFVHLPSATITELARVMFEAKFKTGEVIVAQGDLVDSVYFIAQGTAEVTRKMDLHNKSEIVFLASLHQNDGIGLAEKGYFAPGGIRTATVTATSDTLLLGLKIADFYRFLQEHPNFNQDTQVATELMIRMNFIKEVTSFVQLSLGRIRWLAQNLEKITISKDTVIFTEGEPGDKCYLIYDGQVEISVNDRNEGKKILAVLKSPMMFGETALFTNSPRNATAIATEECVLFAIRRQNLLELAAMEDTTNQAIRSLMVERSRPLRTPNIQDYHNTTADGQEIITLKNPINSHYYRLNKEGWFIWQQVNGHHSLREITQAFIKQFNGVDANIVPTAIFNLANAGFIQIASLNINEKNNQSLWARTKRWWISMIIVLIAVAGIISYTDFNRYSKSDTLSVNHISVAPIVTMVLAVDLDNTNEITPDNIKNGNVPILIIHNIADTSTHTNDSFSFISQFAQLIFFDSDKNGRIDMSDPAFTNLELVFLSSNPAKVKYLPISAAGIRAIDLDKAKIIHYAMTDQPNKFNEIENAVIMVNGSTRRMQIVPVDQNVLP